MRYQSVLFQYFSIPYASHICIANTLPTLIIFVNRRIVRMQAQDIFAKQYVHLSWDNKNGRRTQAAPVYDRNTQVVMAEMLPGTLPTSGILPPELELSGSASMQPKDFLSSLQVQLRSLDRNTMINMSIFVIAIVTVAIQVFSVNTGFTRGWSPEEIAYRVPIDNWRSYNDICSYGLVPVENRLLRVDLVEIFWVAILATQASGAADNGNKPDVQDEVVGV